MNLPIKTIDFLLMKLLVVFLPFMFYLNTITRLNISISDIVILVIFIWMLLNRENTSLIGLVIKKYRFMIIYICLLIYFCVLSMWNYFTNLYVDVPYGFAAVLKLSFNFIYVILFLVFLEKYKKELMKVVLRWWKIGAIIVTFLCVIGVILYRVGFDNSLTLDGRAQGSFNDPNLAALYLIVSFALIGLLNVMNSKRMTVSLSMVFILIAIFLTASRGGILAVVLTIAFLTFISYSSGRVKEFLAFSMVVVVCLTVIFWLNSTTEVLSFAMERLSEIGAEEDGTSKRLFLWETAFQMWSDNPVIGVGIGQYIPYSTEMLGYTISNIPHNTYLSFLSETGILGFTAFLWFPIYLFLKLIAGLLTVGNKKYFYLLIGLSAMAIQALSINIENFRFAWLFLALIFFLIKNDEVERDEKTI